MITLDPFTQKRILRNIENHRVRTGQLPSLKDIEDAGFSKDMIKEAIRLKVIEEFYVTLTNGTILKGLKPVSKPE